MNKKDKRVQNKGFSKKIKDKTALIGIKISDFCIISRVAFCLSMMSSSWVRGARIHSLSKIKIKTKSE